MPRPPAVDAVGAGSTRRPGRGLPLAVLFTTLVLTACSQSRQVTITSPCETDVLVDWLYRSRGGNEVVQESTVIEAGEHVYTDAVETEYIALKSDGEILAETSLPADQLDTDGANPFPPMTIPADACATLAPAPGAEPAEDGT